jgi:hypothetical protein
MLLFTMFPEPLSLFEGLIDDLKSGLVLLMAAESHVVFIANLFLSNKAYEVDVKLCNI